MLLFIYLLSFILSCNGRGLECTHMTVESILALGENKRFDLVMFVIKVECEENGYQGMLPSQNAYQSSLLQRSSPCCGILCTLSGALGARHNSRPPVSCTTGLMFGVACVCQEGNSWLVVVGSRQAACGVVGAFWMALGGDFAPGATGIDEANSERAPSSEDEMLLWLEVLIGRRVLILLPMGSRDGALDLLTLLLGAVMISDMVDGCTNPFDAAGDARAAAGTAAGSSWPLKFMVTEWAWILNELQAGGSTGCMMHTPTTRDWLTSSLLALVCKRARRTFAQNSTTALKLQWTAKEHAYLA